jgi:hypothetical protein
VPDVGWPDIFNSGVMVFSPGEDKYKEIVGLLKEKGSWDGADQGLLNEWRGANWNRLSFTYNTTPTAAYTYVPPLFFLLLCSRKKRNLTRKQIRSRLRTIWAQNIRHSFHRHQQTLAFYPLTSAWRAVLPKQGDERWASVQLRFARRSLVFWYVLIGVLVSLSRLIDT